MFAGGRQKKFVNQPHQPDYEDVWDLRFQFVMKTNIFSKSKFIAEP